MIPGIDSVPSVPKLYLDYLAELKKTGFSGDMEERYGARLLAATDNSVYHCLPCAVIFPKNEADVVQALQLGGEDKFKSITFVPRGGGTGTNGQSLNRGIVIDTSRYMKHVGELKAEAREITAGPGVIKDELNELINPYGLFFSPELSTSSRATLGGMVSNDAAGQGSLKYGRTSSHIKALKMVLIDGTVALFKPVKGDELKAKLALDNLEGKIYRGAYKLLKECRPLVKEIFPKLNRFMTGYDLDHAYNDDEDELNLHRLVCGAEGTLGFITEITLDLTPVPSYRGMAVIKYKNFDAALRQAPLLVAAGSLSVETVDSKVLSLAKQDPVWLKAAPYIKEVAGKEILGVNIVEFAGTDAKKEQALLHALKDKQEKYAANDEMGVIGVQITEEIAGINAVYAMRKKAVGLLGSAHGRKKLVAFTEDTVVPPEHLADYIKEFRALLDDMKVPYGMFGHVDTGLMHVRPGLDLTTDEDRKKLVKISDAVVTLVKKYQGQMWGEHGRGYRSCYGEDFFKQLYPAARTIKTLFDPDNRLNPGKICVPLGHEDNLVQIDGLMRGDLDRQIPLSVQEHFAGALSCNGNGQCFSYQKSAKMCPSYRYSSDHVRSPKGFSSLMREWLRLVAQEGWDPDLLEQRTLTESRLNPITFIKRACNTLFDKDDFNHQYKEYIRTCVACKSCKTDCPAHVNAADLNSRFLALYYSRYLRPPMDLITLNAEWLIPLIAKVPRIANALLKNRLIKAFNKKVLGLADLPFMDELSLKKEAQKHDIPYLSLRQAAKCDVEVLIVVDPFSAAYEVQGLLGYAKLIAKLGFKPGFLRPYVNGKLSVIRGDRRSFLRFAAVQASRLKLLSVKGMTLTGYDPALTICYRDEYETILSKKSSDFEVLLPEEWLFQAIADPEVKNRLEGMIKKSHMDLKDPFYLFCHCTENALIPRAVTMWQEVLKAFGLTLLPVPVSCCGMAGLFGHMQENLEESYRIYSQNWAEQLKKRPFERCLFTGFSCRSQVRRMEKKQAVHPVEVLLQALG